MVVQGALQFRPATLTFPPHLKPHCSCPAEVYSFCKARGNFDSGWGRAGRRCGAQALKECGPTATATQAQRQRWQHPQHKTAERSVINRKGKFC